MQRCVRRGPPRKLAGGETAQAQPEPVAVVDEQFERGSIAIAKDKQRAGKRILLPLLTAECGQGVDPFAEINRIDGEEDPELRHQLQHRL